MVFNAGIKLWWKHFGQLGCISYLSAMGQKEHDHVKEVELGSEKQSIRGICFSCLEVGTHILVHS